MQVEISKQEFPRYKGIRELVPGHLYLDDKGVQHLFLGRGEYLRKADDGNPLFDWSTKENVFLYMKWDDIQKKISQHRLNSDLMLYDSHGSQVDFWRTVYASEKPRTLVVDLGAKYPDRYFLDLIIADRSYLYYSMGPGTPYHWEIHTY